MRRADSASASIVKRACAGVLASRLPPERSTRRTCDSQAGRVGDVLDRLAGPHGIEARVFERPFAVDVQQTQIEPGVLLARTPQRLLGDVHADDRVAGARHLGGQLRLAAADVEHAQRLAGAPPPSCSAQSVEQERAAQIEVARLRAFGDALPDRFVVSA